jgi:hypothetical protein
MFGRIFGRGDYAIRVQAVLENEFGKEEGQRISHHSGTVQIVNAYRRDGISPEQAAKYIILKIKHGPKTPEEFEIQLALASELEKYGVNFMSYDPEVHYALLKEAISFKRIPRTVQMFMEIAEQIAQRVGSEEQKAAMLVQAYRRRALLMTNEFATPFDSRNPELAVIFHKLKDEVEGPNASVANLNNAHFINCIDGDYEKYLKSNTEGRLSPEQGFRALVSDMVGVLLSTEKKWPDEAKKGVTVGLVVILRVVFGAGPGYSKAINRDPYITTLAILAKIVTEYRARPAAMDAETEFVKAASWTFLELYRRCQREYGTP